MIVLRLTASDRQRISELYALRDRTNAELCSLQDGTLQFIRRKSAVTAEQLAAEFRLTLPNANNRLIRLVRVGILERQQIPPNGRRGGRKFLYSLVEQP